MRLLFVKEALAWPRSSGHDVHCFHMMQALAALGHDVSLATVKPTSDEAIAGLPLRDRICIGEGSAAGAEPQPLPLSRLQERFRSYWGIDPARIRAVAAAARASEADAVIVVGLNVLPYLAGVSGALRVWYAADEWAWHHLSQVRLLRPSSWGNVKEAAVKGLYERAYAPLLDRVWVVSEGDRRAMQWVAGFGSVDVTPNGVDADYFAPRPAEQQPCSCVFWGRLDFGPNVQALEWFCGSVWPAVRLAFPKAQFAIFGFHPTPQVRELAAVGGVELVPDLPDLRAEIARRQVVVLPFVSGGGIKNKLLEAAAMGKAVLCTPRACGGLRRDAAAPVTQVKTPRQWVSALTALWADAELCRRQGDAAHRWVTEHHTWLAAARTAATGLETTLREAVGMKQLIFMIVVTLIGVVGSLAISPFYGVAVYYFFAVLRPQFIWQWSLPEGVAWSFYVAIAAMIGTALNVRSKTTPPDPAGGWRLSAAHWAILLFGAWVLLTYVTARNQAVAYPYFIEYLKLFVMFWVAARVIRTVRQVWVLYLLTAGTLGYIAYEVNYIYFFQGGYTYIYKRGYGGLDNNGAGLMLAMGVPLCYFAWEGVRRWFRWAFLALIPVLLHAVLMSYSRGAMVSLLAAVPLYLLRSRHKIQLALILVGIGALIPVLAGKEIRARFFTLEQTEIDESANQRRAAWAAAWQIAKENPVFGVGIRNANLLSHQYGADRQGRTIHSLYLQTAADSGFVALALYLTALVIFWLSTRHARLAVKKRTDPEGPQAYAMASGVEAAMVVFCVGAAFLSLENFELPYLMLLIGAQLPLVLAPNAAGATTTAQVPAATHDSQQAAANTDVRPVPDVD